MADLLALKGDAIDNIPGAPGIGDKGAVDLIAQFGSVEAALDRAGEVTRKMYRESLQQNRERILLSKRLATIERAVPIECDLETLVAAEPEMTALRAAFKELEFHSHLKELGPAEDTRPRDLGTLEDAPLSKNTWWRTAVSRPWASPFLMRASASRSAMMRLAACRWTWLRICARSWKMRPSKRPAAM